MLIKINYLNNQGVPFGSEFLRRHVDKGDAYEKIDEGIVGTLLQRRDIFA